MRMWFLFIIEVAGLLLVHTSLTQEAFRWVVFMFMYFGMGYLHGRLFGLRTDRAIFSIIGINALVGILISLLNIGGVPNGESKFFWFLIGAFTNMFVYAFMPSTVLFYGIAYLGIKTSRKSLSDGLR